MADIILQIEHLTTLPDRLHWFCPRVEADDQSVYYDDDVADRIPYESDEDKRHRAEKVKETVERKKHVFQACQILAFDGADAQPYQEKLKDHFKQQLTRCTICVREFHRGRAELKHELEEQYDPEQVEGFMERFDQMNIDRITTGLDSATATLLDLEPSHRKITALPLPEMFALFETMHCMPLLQGEDLLQNHFDKPFRLVQTNSKISLPEYTPALTSFLFGDNPERLQWALRAWRKFKRNITGAEFDWTVRDTLRNAMNRANMPALYSSFMPTFWRGARTIVEKLDQELVTHHLRALEIDVCRLALDNLQLDSTCYLDLIATLQLLLEKAPKDVWDALGTISPQTLVEQIFNNAQIERLMLVTGDQDLPQLQTALSWIDPFVKSIKAANLPPACRSVLQQLVVRFQENRFPATARRASWRVAMYAIAEALTVMQNNRQTGGAAIADMLEMLGNYKDAIMLDVDRCRGSLADQPDQQLDLQVIERALSLDCHSLALDRDAIANRKALAHDINVSSLAIFKIVVRGVRSGDVAIASSIFDGVRKLLVLEPLTKRQIEVAPKVANAWNNGLSRIQTYIGELLDRLQDFEPEDLLKIFASQESTTGFFALLFSGNQQIQQTAATILKVASSESSRRDGVRSILDKFYIVPLHAFAATFRTIARAKSFTPSMTVLKMGTDFLESLCDSEDGVLRSRKVSKEEAVATEYAWQSLWIVIDTIFDSTELWSQYHDKSLMMEFCKDTMDFADRAFDQYSVFSGALQDPDSGKDETKELDRRLLEKPREVSGNVVKWLRLRDEYLIAKAVTITCSMMSRLKDASMVLPDETVFYIENINMGETRSKLTASQKAELRKALDNHLDRTPINTPEPETQKPQKQGSLTSWVSSATGSGMAQTAMPDRKKHTIDIDSWSASAQRQAINKEMNDAQKKVLPPTSSTREMLRAKGDLQSRAVGLAGMKAMQQQPSSNDFRRKRLEEQEAKKKRDAAIIAAAKKGSLGIGEAGSGLAGLGVDGKDHSVKGSGVMVSSGEESEDDDDDPLAAELFGGSKSKSSKRKDTVRADAAGAIGMKREQKGPVKIQRLVRSQKDMRARLAPELSSLHKVILGWDFFHDGHYPPNSRDHEFRGVDSSYRHVGEYQNTFRPLLTLEAWQGFVKAREEDATKVYEIKIGSRSSVDAFLEISTSVTHAENREIQASEGDIILFSTAAKPTSSPEAPHCLARVYRINRKKQHLEIVYRVMPGTGLNSALTPGSTINGVKIQSIIPLEREFGALTGLQYYDLCDEIIKAKPSPLLNYTDKQLDTLISNYTVNKAQAKAIKSAVDNDAFTLIQGPPGSGKTKTIVAIVGALLSESITTQQTATRINIPSNGSTAQPALSSSRKLLVCAPSNAAVDELLMRLKDGVKSLKGVHKKINVVRLGKSDAINTAVRDVTLDELVKKKLGNINGDNNARERTQALMKEHQNVSEQLRLVRGKLDGGTIKGDEQSKLQDDLNQLRRRKNELGTQIDTAKDAENAAGRNAEVERKRAQQAVLDESHVICATLSGSGHDMFQSMTIEFETVVVDEAAQCVEMSALIPLKYGCAKCILVGDPKQLPPTVFSKEAARLQYEQSLFVRMQSNFPDRVHLLDTQYRMHPDISAFPSATFYDSRLLDGADMASLRQRPWHNSSLLAPYRFFDVEGQHSAAPKGHSLINRAEIEVALGLYDRLVKDHKDFDFNKNIGIITPYKSQLRELKERFSQVYGSAILDTVDFNTTDAFQGRESEVIIFSCVRASPAGNIGFLQDIRRMNVGLTRAKSSLWVLGNSQSLMRGEFWNKLVVDARERDLYTSGNLMAMLRQPSTNFPAKSRPSAPKTAVTAASGKVVPAKPSPAVNGNHKPSPVVASRPAPPMAREGQSARQSTGQSAAPIGNLQPHIKQESLPVKMEGVRVKLEDKLSNKRSFASDSALNVHTDATSRISDQDVDMADNSELSRSGTMTPQGRVAAQDLKASRSTTPASVDGKKPGPPARPNQPSAPVQAAPPRKRKPADPFMPKKKVPRQG